MPKNKEMVIKKLYEKHSVGLLFILRNYKDVLLKLEDEKKYKLLLSQKGVEKEQ